MSEKPVDPDSGLAFLRNEGYRVEVRDQHLFLHDVPYVTSGRQLSRGVLACTYIENAGQVLPPDNHQVWWTGEYPCFPNGLPIEQLRNDDQARELLPGFPIRHRFSNKPEGFSNFSDHYSKLVHYATLIQAQAKAIDREVDARDGVGVFTSDSSASPFVYADSASARAEIQLTSSRLAMKRVAIIGLGGTGSYILDQIAKTPVTEIHLFDGDVFLQHNAFRAPGAASLEDFALTPNKAAYFKSKYEAMHRGIVSHQYNVSSSNIDELQGFTFVFLSIDHGATRRLAYEYLSRNNTPFIDVGMNLHLVAATGKLVGTCRVTLCTPTQSDHFPTSAPMDDGPDEEVYRQNIQVADMNALNAQLAVMRWKQYCGFYQDDFTLRNATFSVNSMSLARDAAPSKEVT